MKTFLMPLYPSEKPDLSLGDLKYHFDVSKTSLWRILRHDLQWRPYKSRRVHKLQDGDTMFRRAYCRNMLQILSTKPDFLNYILWTDECFFRLDGVANTNNMIFWASENPNICTEANSTSKAGLMVFAGMWSGG